MGLDGMPVSTDRTRGFVATGKVKVSDNRPSRGCGSVLCRFSKPELTPYAAAGDI